MSDKALRGNRLTFAKGGVVKRPKKPSTHGKDVPTMAARGGRIGKAIGGPAARAIKGAADKVLKPRDVFKRDKSWYESRQKPPQLKKSDKEIKEELRKQARKSGAHSKIIFADEWKHIDPGLQKGLFKKEGGRIGLKKGKMPWGTGPKPGTLEFLQHTTQTPKRKRKAIGGVLHAVTKLAKKLKKKKVYPETEDLTHQVGPYVGDVGSEGKRRTMGPKGISKSPGPRDRLRDRPKGIGQSPGPKGKRPWPRTPSGTPEPRDRPRARERLERKPRERLKSNYKK